MLSLTLTLSTGCRGQSTINRSIFSMIRFLSFSKAELSNLIPAVNCRSKGLIEGECVAASSSCSHRLQLPTGRATSPIDRILPNLPQTDQDQDSAKNLTIDEILGVELFGINVNTSSVAQIPNIQKENATCKDPERTKEKQSNIQTTQERVYKSCEWQM
jgi:hypothetical protein